MRAGITLKALGSFPDLYFPIICPTLHKQIRKYNFSSFYICIDQINISCISLYSISMCKNEASPQIKVHFHKMQKSPNNPISTMAILAGSDAAYINMEKNWNITTTIN